jgi:hypothetical protein
MRNVQQIRDRLLQRLLGDIEAADRSRIDITGASGAPPSAIRLNPVL